MNSKEAHLPVNFFRNYTRVVGIAYAAIVLGLFVVFAHQLQQKVNEEVVVIQTHFERHAQFFEFVLRSSGDQLEALRMAALSESDEGLEQRTQSRLRQLVSSEAGFSLDTVLDRDIGGNFIGQGTTSNRAQPFYKDLNIAFALLPAFRTLNFTLPSVVQGQYLSAENFHMVSPWIPSNTKPFSADDYKTPAWKMGKSNEKLDQARYWAPIYFSNKEQGLLVPAAVPIYQDKRFAGVLSIDTSLDYLNRINGSFGYPMGTPFLVDSFGDVLAHPKLYANPAQIEIAPKLQQALPASLASANLVIADLANNKPLNISGQLVLRHRFVSAPWDLVYTIPFSDIWSKLLTERGWAMASVLGAIALMMFVVYRITAKEFVSPASRLVQHLSAESKFVKSPIPNVPLAWRPWFETISQVFRESLQLIGLRQELDIAAKMQASILPRHWPEHPSYSVWGTMRSAKEVGGDFYDHFPTSDDKLGLVVADVSGKGIPAALFGTVSKTLLRAIAVRSNDDAGTIVGEVNNGLCEDNDSCMFVTTLYCTFDATNGRVTFVNAGHPLPLVISANGQARYLSGASGMALGIMEDIEFKQMEVQLEAGDILLMFTDGVTEAMNTESIEYGTDRLLALFQQTERSTHSVRETVERMMNAVDSFAAGAVQSDDITCIALQYHPRGTV